jgi:tetraacyldisaccharide 4'-kinase
MRLFEFVYYCGYRIKRTHDLKRRMRLPSRVISVGNITAGGTGKTPLTIAIAEEALRRGFSPAVLTRGYRGKLEAPCLVRAGMDEEEVGDEPLLMAEKLRDIPVIKGRDRYEAGMFALEKVMGLSKVTDLPEVTDIPLKGAMPQQKGAMPQERGAMPQKKGAMPQKRGAMPLFLLDDGYQHWRLYRDKDILLIDAGNPFDLRRLLPVGLLREPIREVGRADIIVLTKGKGSDNRALISEVRRYNPRAPLFVSDHEPSYVVTSKGEMLSLNWLSGRKVYAFCGIGDPDSFRTSLEKAGAALRGFKAYRDHYRYKRGEMEHIVKAAEASGARWIITTEKDIMRLKSVGLPENLLALGLEVRVDEGFYEEVFKFNDPQGPEVIW